MLNSLQWASGLFYIMINLNNMTKFYEYSFDGKIDTNDGTLPDIIIGKSFVGKIIAFVNALLRFSVYILGHRLGENRTKQSYCAGFSYCCQVILWEN